MMPSVRIDLFVARDGEETYAIRLAQDDESKPWRAVKGFGRNFERVWRLELTDVVPPDPENVDWGSVLDRVIEAYEMSDPLVTGFQWPLRKETKRRSAREENQ